MKSQAGKIQVSNPDPIAGTAEDQGGVQKIFLVHTDKDIALTDHPAGEDQDRQVLIEKEDVVVIDIDLLVLEGHLTDTNLQVLKETGHQDPGIVLKGKDLQVMKETGHQGLNRTDLRVSKEIDPQAQKDGGILVLKGMDGEVLKDKNEGVVGALKERGIGEVWRERDHVVWKDVELQALRDVVWKDEDHQVLREVEEVWSVLTSQVETQDDRQKLNTLKI